MTPAMHAVMRCYIVFHIKRIPIQLLPGGSLSDKKLMNIIRIMLGSLWPHNQKSICLQWLPISLTVWRQNPFPSLQLNHILIFKLFSRYYIMLWSHLSKIKFLA